MRCRTWYWWRHPEIYRSRSSLNS